MNWKRCIKIFATLVNTGTFEETLKGGLPNIPFWTLGGKVLWNTVYSYRGWKIQQNQLTHHCRILNSKNIRVAWGTEKQMEELFERLEKY